MSSDPKIFCPRCLISGKGHGWSCGKPHSDYYISSKVIRFPAKKSSKQRWKEFIAYMEDIWIYKNSRCEYSQKLRDCVSILKRTVGLK